MPNPMLEEIAAMIPSVEQTIGELRELIAVAEGADQDVTSQKAELRMQEMKLDKWKKSLIEHGYKI